MYAFKIFFLGLHCDVFFSVPHIQTRMRSLLLLFCRLKISIAHAQSCFCLTIMADNVTERWYFTKAQLKDTPSRRCDIDEDKELSYRQQAATLIQDMGQRLSVYPLVFWSACLGSAMVENSPVVQLYSCVSCFFHYKYCKQGTLYRILRKISSLLTLNLMFRSQLTINTAIVYMHRFYMFHSFSKVHRNVS